jgi:hypothetical protein
MCALVAVKHDPQLKEYYERKKGEGKMWCYFNNVNVKLLSFL